MANPRYRVVASNPIGIGSHIYVPGEEFNFAGWIDQTGIEPINDEARRVADYAKKHFKDPFRPTVPKNDLAGGIYLPAVTDARASIRVVAPAPDGAPMYEVSKYSDLVTPQGTFPAGSKICVLGWLTRSLEPVNKAAHLVAAYYEANKNNPALLPCPWCQYRDALVLPELPPVRVIDHDRTFGRSAHHRSSPQLAPRKSMRRRV